jgi:Na+(H+)/acetate symporter ActP
MNSSYAVPAVALVVVATVLVGAFGLRISRTTSDFYVASRTVGPRLNAAAISGEYLSAASFLGIAGLVLVQGPDMLWYPVGYTAGYLVLLLFVAAPLRRSGAYTLPDFAEARLGSPGVRRLAGAFVVGVGWLYLLPQLQGAGLTLTVLTGAPDSLGGLIVALVVVATVAAGGMRSITFVQAFQYWLKLTALLVPALFLAVAWQGDGSPSHAFAEPATFREQRVIHVDDSLDLKLAAPLTVTVTGTVDGRAHDGRRLELPAGTHHIAKGTRLSFAKGSAVPAADPGTNGGMSTSLATGRQERPLYATYGLILATFLGTMGLPHVVVRFYTSPHGVAARRTTVAVLGLIGAFYLLPPLYGALGRLYTPELVLTGDADAAVLLLPDRMIGGVGLRRVPVHGVRADHGRRGRPHPGRPALPRGTALPARHGARHGRAARRQRPGGRAAGGGRGGAGLRGVRLLLLPAAGARHLVAAADPAGRGGRDADRGRLGVRGGRGDDGGRARHGPSARSAGLARTLVGAAGLPHHGAGVPGHRGPGTGRDGGDPGALSSAGGTAGGGEGVSGRTPRSVAVTAPACGGGGWHGRAGWVVGATVGAWGGGGWRGRVGRSAGVTVGAWGGGGWRGQVVAATVPARGRGGRVVGVTVSVCGGEGSRGRAVDVLSGHMEVTA